MPFSRLQNFTRRAKNFGGIFISTGPVTFCSRGRFSAKNR
jgi:hypothetical protein